jgi:hypothetical protein
MFWQEAERRPATPSCNIIRLYHYGRRSRAYRDMNRNLALTAINLRAGSIRYYMWLIFLWIFPREVRHLQPIFNVVLTID